MPRTKRLTSKVVLATTAAAALFSGAMLASSATAAQAATQGPCDIYAAAGTPCVAAHSTTRALYASYNGSLYQVRRSSDKKTLNIGVVRAGGVANAAAQDSFCANTTCLITVIYDQSGKGNNLTQAPAGGAAGGPDNLANAIAAPTTLHGHKAYGVYVAPGTGYRDNHTTGIATGDKPEGEYAIFDGTHYNGGCCFDYGNAETNSHDDGNGTMEAIYFGNIRVWGYGAGNGPWIMADLENGLFSGVEPALQRRRPDHQLPLSPPRWSRAARTTGPSGAATPSPAPYPPSTTGTPQRLRLQPDAQTGRDHPGHRRRQQQGRRRYLLRRRDDHRVPLGRHGERRAGQHHLGRVRRQQLIGAGDGRTRTTVGVARVRPVPGTASLRRDVPGSVRAMPQFDLSLDELHSYSPSIAEPAELDSFWATTLAQAASRHLDATFSQVDTGLSLLDSYDVTFAGFDGDPVRAWLHLPAHRSGPLPCVVEYVGYGGGRGLVHERLLWACAGYAYLVMDTRGQGSGWSVGDTPDPHGSTPASPGHLTRGILDPADYYYRRVFTDAVRAVAAARSHPDVDETRIAVTGASQAIRNGTRCRATDLRIAVVIMLCKTTNEKCCFWSNRTRRD